MGSNLLASNKLFRYKENGDLSVCSFYFRYLPSIIEKTSLSY